MNRDRELEHAIAYVLQAIRADSHFDLPAYLAERRHLMPELGEALERQGISIESIELEQTVDPGAHLPSTFEFQPSRGTPAEQPSALQYVGEYRLEHLLGKGAYGEVWQAMQVSLKRHVAVKLLHSQHGSEELIRRFRREAELLAQLKHRNIVNVLEVGTDQGRHYIAMELVEGTNLKQHMEQGLPACRWSAETMRTLAEAIAHAHGAEVVHRDLKPGNLLLSNTGELKVTDFGLAKRITAESDLTIDGTVLGTLVYMPPEQALGHNRDVGPPADIYSIGATLYHLLTGRPPFPTRSDLPPAAIFDEIRDREPIAPRRLCPERNIPRDLETIALKCLAKEPVRRYATAQALADDLGRYLAGEPIEARAVSRAEAAWMRIKRRPLLSALTAAAVLAMLTAAGFAARGMKLGGEVEFARQSLAQQSQTLEKTTQEKTAADLKAAAAAQEAQEAEAKAAAAADRRLLLEYLTDMNEAQSLWERGELQRMEELLARHAEPVGYDPRGFEWYFLHQQLAAPAALSFAPSETPWNRLAFNHDGTRLAAMDRAGTLVCWDLASQEEQFRVAGPGHSFAFHNDGNYCVVLKSAKEGTFQVLESSTGKQLGRFRAGPITTCFAMHPVEQKILTGNISGEMFLYGLPGGKRLADMTANYKRSAFERSLDIEHGTIFSLAWSPDGSWFAVGWEDGTVQLWEAASQKINRRVDITHDSEVVGLAFSPRGDRLASQSVEAFNRLAGETAPGVVRVTQLPDGAQLTTVVANPDKIAENSTSLMSGEEVIPFGEFVPAFSANGEQLFTTGSRAASRWNVKTGDREAEYPGHDGLVYAIALSPDHSQVAATGEDGTIRVWPAQGIAPYTEICAAFGGIHSIKLSPGGKYIAAVCDRGLTTWARSAPTRDRDSALWIWNAATGEKLLGEDIEYAEKIDFSGSTLEFNPAGSELTQMGKRFELAESGVRAVGEQQENKGAITEFQAPDRSFMVRKYSYEPKLELVREESPDQPILLHKHEPEATVVVISPDSKWIATGGDDHLVCLWSSSNGKLMHECREHAGEITTLEFSPDGRHLLSGGMDRKICAWEVATGKQAARFLGHRREISGIAFTADGERFASSSGLLKVLRNEKGYGGEVRLWDFATGRLCIELKRENEIYSDVAMAPDGSRIFTAVNSQTTVAPGKIVCWDGTSDTTATQGTSVVE